MSDEHNLKESLSALLDNEAGREDELELRRVVKACADDVELQAAYERYSLVRDVLAGEPVCRNNLVGKVRAAIADQSFDEGESPAKQFAWNRILPVNVVGQVAVAASVAVLVVFVAQWQNTGVSDKLPVAEQEFRMPDTQVVQNGRPLPANVIAVNVGEARPDDTNNELAGSTAAQSIDITAAQLEQQRRARMQKYLMYHLEHASLNDSRGMMPFARVSYFEERR